MLNLSPRGKPTGLAEDTYFRTRRFMPEFVCAAVIFPPSMFFPASVPTDTDYCANSIRPTTPAWSEGQSPEGFLSGILSPTRWTLTFSGSALEKIRSTRS